MPQDELIFQLALTLVPNIGDVHARILIQKFGNASDIFKANQAYLEKIEGIGSVRARSIKSFKDFAAAESEAKFIDKYKINALFITDAAYPRRLLNCYDAPVLLFYMGTADLNASRVLGVVGTRSNSEYGKSVTEKLVKDLATENVVVVSGLAFGIDAIAHKVAVKHKIPTIGVVGHGLDKIYPAEHTPLAKEMVKEGGGILTEFFSGTKPDKHNFPLRNRLVAGLCDATVVVETAVKGGSMITAKLADAYNRDVFAVPGRLGDKGSAGTNHLISHNKAILYTGADQLLEIMGWRRKPVQKKQQREIFVDLSAEEQAVIRILQEQESVHIDDLHLKSNLSSSSVAAAILNLELQGLINSLPGKQYQLA